MAATAVAQRPNLITFYFSDVDSAGYDFGPDSVEVNAAIGKIDKEITVARRS